MKLPKQTTIYDRQVEFMHNRRDDDFSKFVEWRESELKYVVFFDEIVPFGDADEEAQYNWIVENLKGVWCFSKPPYPCYYFELQDDAMLFKLRWGGE